MSDIFTLSNMDGTYQGLQTRRETRFPLRMPLTWQLLRNPNPLAPESVFPARFLPVTSIDSNVEDGIVIPMGVITSLKPVFPTSVYAIAGADTELGISASGSIIAGKNAYGSNITYSVEDQQNAYGDYQNSVLVISNGGTAVQDRYSSLDVQLETVKADGTVAAAGDAYARSANIPYGVTTSPVYQDYRGRYLNSDGTKLQLDAPYRHGYIWVPFVINDASNTYKFAKLTHVAGVQSIHGASASDHAGYLACLPKCGFLWLGSRDGVADANVDVAFLPGEFVVSDYNGRFVPQSATTADALTAQKTAQTVGRIVTLDSKWPKSLRGLEDTYPGSGMTGTDTAGVDKFIYEFVEGVLKAAGQAYTRTDVLTAIKSGRFGMASIEVLAV